MALNVIGRTPALRLLNRINKTGEDSERVDEDDLLQVLSFANEADRVLKFIQRGIERGKVPDESILRWNGSKELKSLSAIIAETLKLSD